MTLTETAAQSVPAADSAADASVLTEVRFWFDPACPWAWMSSRWLLEAARVRGLEPKFRVMSLSVLNEGRDDLPEEYQDLIARTWGPVRVCIAARREAGEEILAPLYTALGERIHVQARGITREVVEEALVEVGLPVSLADAMDTDAFDEELRASHAEAMELVGTDVGTPVIAVGDTAFFGPVVTPAPKGEDAGRLWDGVLAVASTPGFYELKRSRTQGPDFS